MNKIRCKLRLRRRRKVVQASCTACARGSAVVERGTWRLLLIERHPPHTVCKKRTSTTHCVYKNDIHHWSGLVDVRCDGCLVWWMSDFTHGVVNVQSGQCLVWWMSFFYTQCVVDVWCENVWCGGCPVWWRSVVVNVLFHSSVVWCSEFLLWWISFFAHSVADIWFRLVDVCVVDVIKSI